jgi:hypothetical protein
MIFSILFAFSAEKKDQKRLNLLSKVSQPFVFLIDAFVITVPFAERK